jgi:hypothetical protein
LYPVLAQPRGQVVTSRLGQVSGRVDPEDLPHYQDTAQYGIEGVDLGASTLHNGKTYIFFGDVPRLGRREGPIQDADAIGLIDDVHLPRRTDLFAVKQGDDQSNVFFIGENGALYISWVAGAGHWVQPVQITLPALAPPGGAVAAALQTRDQLDVFFIGNNGALYVAWVIGKGAWQGPRQIGGPNVAKPGGNLVAIRQLEEQLDVLFIGQNRRLQVAWVVGNGHWQGPISIEDRSFPYPAPVPGSGIAAAYQGANQRDVFFIGEDGGFYVAFSKAGGRWEGPLLASPRRLPVSVPGGNLAVLDQAVDLVTALCVDTRGRLSAMFLRGAEHWQGPVPVVASAPLIRPGSPVAVHRQGANQWNAFVTRPDGGIDVYWVRDRKWEGPAQIAPPGSTSDDSSLAVINQLPDQTTLLSASRSGALNVQWVKGAERWQGPIRTNPDMTVRFLTSGDYFLPLTIKGYPSDPAKVYQLGTDATPSGAFSYGGRLYVFFVTKRFEDPNAGFSALASGEFPEGGQPFNYHFTLSTWPDPNGGHFLQVAPVVTRSAEIPGVVLQCQDCVVLFGHGGSISGVPERTGCIEPKSPTGVQLAIMPLMSGRGPMESGMRYYTGGTPPTWSAAQTDAHSLFSTCYFWTALSAGRIPGTGKWILLYQLAGPRSVAGAHNQPIVARIADTPWGIASAQEIVVFHPDRDRAWNRFMFADNIPDSDKTQPNGLGHPPFPYGAYLLHKYMRWDARRNTVTIFFVMSTGRPYQVQMMRSEITL